MLRLLPSPFLVRCLAATNPTECVAPFAADQRDHLAVGQDAQRRFVGMAGHIEMRDQFVLHAVGAGDELQLPIGRPGFGLARFRRVLGGR